jgi:hypothetical protein
MYLDNIKSVYYGISISGCWHGARVFDVWHIFSMERLDCSDVESYNDCGSVYVGF